MQMDLIKCCRTCLSNDHDMRKIDTAISIAGNDVRLADILEKFYSCKIKSDDHLSKYICINCVSQLTMTYSFKILIDKTAKKLSDESVLFIVECNNDQDNDCVFDSNDDAKNPKKLTTSKNFFIKKSSWNSTIKTNYFKKKILYCVHCKEKFQSRNGLYYHCVKKHPNEKKLGRHCDFCNDRFEEFKSLIAHRKKHLTPYLCEACWEGFVHSHDLSNHFCKARQSQSQMEPQKMLRQCDQCGKSYPPGYIKMHMLIHGEKRAYSCKYCPKRFKVPCALNSHVLWNHKRTRNHKCEVCNASFISASARSIHFRKLHLREKKHSCESCSKSFFSKSELQRHNLTHTGAKNFHCHLCEKSYQTRYGLNTHLKSHMHIT